MGASVTDQGFIWIDEPTPYNWKIEIDSVDRTSDVLSMEVIKISTFAIGSFEITLDNNGGTYDNIVGNEPFIFYADTSDASTEIFEGVIEKIERKLGENGYTIVLKGGHLGVELLNKTVTKSYTDTAISTIISELISAYLPTFTDNNVASITTTATVNWSNKPFLDCMIDLCKLGDCDFYIDNDRDFHVFISGSILNTNEAVTGASNGNLVSMEGFGDDTARVKNKIIVYGEDGDGNTIVATAEDSTSQENYSVKESVIKDTDINTYDDAKERADAELELLKDTHKQGTVLALWMLTLEPGEKLWISVPDREIHDKFIIKKITHNFPDLTTECEIYEEHKRLPQIFKDRIEKDLSTEKIENPHSLEASYNFTFDDDTGLTHSGTETLEGSLVLSAGKTTGTCESTDAREASSNITQIHFKVKGQDYDSSSFYISVNDGYSYEFVTVDSLYTVEGTGKKLKWKVTLASDSNNPKPKINSLAVLYK